MSDRDLLERAALVVMPDGEVLKDRFDWMKSHDALLEALATIRAAAHGITIINMNDRRTHIAETARWAIALAEQGSQ